MEMNPSQETSPIGPITDELSTTQAMIPNTGTGTSVNATGVLRTPQKDMQNPAKSILKKTSSFTPLLNPFTSLLKIDSGDWITVPSRKSTRDSSRSETSQTSRNLTEFEYQDVIAVDYSTKNGS